MSSFTDKLDITPNNLGTEWTINSPFRYWIDKLHVGDVITVPKGATTDFASIPRIFWSIYPPYGLYGKAAIIHDYLYRNGGYINIKEDGLPIFMKNFTRIECDEIFLDGMECLGVNKFTRYAMYRMVRWFGKNSYNSRKINEEYN